MQDRREEMWINELKNDFLEYTEIIELIDWEAEKFLELIEDYYFCKQQIKMLKKTGKSTLMQGFIEVHEDLKQEILLMLSAKKANP